MNKTLIKDFLNHLKYVEQLSQQTITAYEFDLIVFSKERDVLTVSQEDLRAYLSSLQKNHSSSSVARMMSSIRKFYNYLLTARFIKNNPTQFLSVSQKKMQLPHYLSSSQIEQLLSFDTENEDDYLDKAIIETLYSTGLRVSELCNLKNKSYNVEDKIFKVLGKGNKERIIPFNNRAHQAIMSYHENAKLKWLTELTPYLFVNSKSQPLTRQSVYNRIRKRAQQAGLSDKVTPHILRHSFASSLINEGADLRSVQELLGHKDISTTQIYTHLDKKKKVEMYKQFHPGEKLDDKGENNE